MATVQTKQAIAAMLAAGFKRSEFSVEVEKIYRGKAAGVNLINGRGFYEYGDARIYLKGRSSDRVDRVAALLPGIIEAGLGVSYLIMNGKALHITIETRHSKARRVSFSVYADCSRCGRNYYVIDDSDACLRCRYPADFEGAV